MVNPFKYGREVSGRQFYQEIRGLSPNLPRFRVSLTQELSSLTNLDIT